MEGDILEGVESLKVIAALLEIVVEALHIEWREVSKLPLLAPSIVIFCCK